MKNLPPVDWNTAAWRNPEVSPKCKVVFTGDWAPIRHFGPVMVENPVGIYGDTLDVLKAADHRVVNLECAMFDGEPILKSGPNLRGGPEHQPCFDVPGFNTAILGNNHTLDFGKEAFRKTIAMLDERGISHVGGGMNYDEATKPLVINVKGVKIGIVSFTEGHDLTFATDEKPGVFGWDIDLVVKRVAEVKPLCDTVLVIPHAGNEYVPYPPTYIQDAYRRIVDAGADAVIAHHPHVPQGIEFRNGAPIFYSLGNYIFYQPVNYYYRKIGFLLEMEFAADGKIAGFALKPYWICDKGLSLLKGDRFKEFTELMRKLSEPLPERGVEAWNADMKERWLRGYVTENFVTPTKIMEEDPRLGAAKMLNKFVTICHYAFYTEVMKRAVDGTVEDAPDDLYELAKAYNDRPIPPELQ